MFSSILAAEQFMKTLKKRVKSANEAKHRNPSVHVVAGAMHYAPSSDLLWSMTQPKGNLCIRFLGWIMIKVLRAITSEVTIDLDSFVPTTKILSNHSNQDDDLSKETTIILAPTHRSFLDFMLISFIAFALPELRIEIPYIVAADEFSRIPILGWLAKLSGAFFVKRGRGTADPKLYEQISSLNDNTVKRKSICIEVFIEGKRSRDRRFIKPKTGFLK